MAGMMDFVMSNLLDDADGADSEDQLDQQDDMQGDSGMLSAASTDPQDLMMKLMTSIGGGPQQTVSPVSVLRNQGGNQGNQGGGQPVRGGTSGGKQVNKPRITSLRELGQIAQMTKAMPPELRNMIMSKVLGLDYQVPQYGPQIAREKTANAALSQRSNMLDRTLDNRTTNTQMGVDQRREASGARQTNLNSYRDQLVKQKKLDAKNNIARSIAILSKNAEDMMPGSKEQMDILKMIQQQHRLYDQMNDDDEKRAQAKKDQAVEQSDNQVSDGAY